ncbi:hypothetical protein [Parasphingorhabdus sp.]|jgi:CelD/BcsL family acetyltransferase involved in cellulose biosynthesis|uniref:hypothetical protein n=1 Tax=Parasphingorhabdus sp. TaxID=2709688 RepID=UPI003001337F|tara:strand:+ start:276 stop:506 length:231 start_codon:yes stop_codon:yes gene_type:complete
MNDAENDNADKEIITMYAPIFRQKLARLEAHGQQDTAEADELRTVLSRIDRAQSCAEREPTIVRHETIHHQEHQAA